MRDVRSVIRAVPARRPDDLARPDRLASVDRNRREERIRGAQPARVAHHYMPGARDDAREDDRAGARGVKGRPRRNRDVDTEMSGAEARSGREERPDDTTRHRPYPR